MAAETSGPLVSVLTPSFNQEAWLPDNLRSVAIQTYPHIEHIVMDGGSTDGSLTALEEADPPVVWRSEADGGQADALNKAFALCRGEIIGWLNSDDAYFDGRVVADVAACFEAHPEADVVYGHAARVTADGRVVVFVWVPPFSRALMRRICYLIQPAVFMRRRALEARFLDDSYQFAMDWELWLRLGEAHRFRRIPRVLAIDRLQPGRKMKTWESVFKADRARLAESHGVLSPWYYGALVRLWYLATRLGGARFALSLPNDLAFTGEQDDRWALFKRQVASRASSWPDDYR
jgi:glycosyltransferase involved in cell wall biosynthesis